jgi:hypothetical protein
VGAKIILIGIIVFIIVSIIVSENQPCYQPPFGAITDMALIIFGGIVAILIFSLLRLEGYIKEKAVKE